MGLEMTLPACTQALFNLICKRYEPMSIEAHLTSVANKRATLKTQIAREMAHPSPNFGLINQLKKQNLRLKEEMQRAFKRLKRPAAAS